MINFKSCVCVCVCAMKNLYKLIVKIGTEYLEAGEKEIPEIWLLRECRKEGFLDDTIKAKLALVMEDYGWKRKGSMLKFV